MSWGVNNNSGGAWETPVEEPIIPANNGFPEANGNAANGNGNGASDNDASAGDNADSTGAQAGQPGANGEWSSKEKHTYNYEEFSGRDGEYDGNAPVYHWDGEEGDLGPEFPELEIEIFGPIEQRAAQAMGPEMHR